MVESFSNSLAEQPQFVFVLVGALIAIGLPALTILGIAGMVTWRKHRATKFAHDLKAEMIAAGMSADEIERVLSAKLNER